MAYNVGVVMCISTRPFQLFRKDLFKIFNYIMIMYTYLHVRNRTDALFMASFYVEVVKLDEFD